MCEYVSGWWINYFVLWGRGCFLRNEFSYGHCWAILADASDNEYLTEGDEQPEESQAEDGANGKVPHAIAERNLKELHFGDVYRDDGVSQAERTGEVAGHGP